MTFTRLFQPGMIGNLKVKNRFVMAPMGNGLTAGDGHVTKEMIDYYVERAKGGVGLIVTMLVRVTPDASYPEVLGLFDDGYIAGFQELVRAMHQYDTKIAVQLCHLGMMPRTPGAGDIEGIVPSVLPWMKKRGDFQELLAHDIDHYVEAFAEATRRARDAGSDAVEFHACHGSLLSAFLSPALNTRRDEYGGSTENRVRFVSEILARSRKKVGAKFPLVVRINGDDDYDGGTREDEAADQALLLERAGADAISVSVGLRYWSPLTHPCYLYPSGVLVPLAARVKKSVRIPVMAVGKLDAVLGERLLEDGMADFIILGRPLLADPYLPKKVQEGKLEEIHQCLYCNNCLFPGRSRLPHRGCTINPFLFRESEYPPKPAMTKKKVMIIGGGLAGLQAAAILAQRGHNVSVYEQEGKLGGQWNVASAMRGKEHYASFTDRLARMVKEAGVKVYLDTKVTKQLVQETKPEVVVLATGAVPRTLEVSGADGPNVVQANDVILGRVEVGHRVAVVGGRFLGMEVAIQLAEQGKEVSLLSRSRISGKQRPISQQLYRALMRQLIGLRVPMYPNCSVIEVTGRGVQIQYNEGVFLLEVDTIVLAVGTESQNSLASELKDIGCDVYLVGDCVAPEDARTATDEATTLALQI